MMITMTDGLVTASHERYKCANRQKPISGEGLDGHKYTHTHTPTVWWKFFPAPERGNYTKQQTHKPTTYCPHKKL